MRTHAFKCAAITLLLFAAGLGGELLFDSQPPPDEKADAVLGDARNLEIAYQQWKAQARQNGADRKLVLPLGYSKGLSAEFTQAHGQAQLDLTDGTLSVEVSGLPNQDAFDLWLVDNGESSVKPEPGDRMLRIDRLQHGGASARLRARLGPEILNNFKLDQIVVARAGKSPGEASMLFGSPSLFQRLYYSEQRGQLTGLADADTATQSLLAAPFSVLILRPVYAAETVSAVLAKAVVNGDKLFNKETFNGNGRTCATCHRKERNFTIDAAFMTTLKATDPLFVAEFNPDLACNDGNPPSSRDSVGCQFENPKLMRQFGLICENVDTFDQPCVMRGVPHTLALNTSLQPATSGLPEMIGWSADGSPTNTLRGFATGAVTQHFTKTLDRQPGTDFRLPNEAELSAMEAFQLSLGRQQGLNLSTLVLNDASASDGKFIFINGNGAAAPFNGTCNACHNNAGARTSFGAQANSNFNTGVEDRPDSPVIAAIMAAGIPRDGGFGNPVTTPGMTNPTGCGDAPSIHCAFGNGAFNTPSLVESADTLPCFHNNTFDTIEKCIEHFTSAAFNDLRTSGKFNLNSTEVAEVAAFLRAINALENRRVATEGLNRALALSSKNLTGAKGTVKQVRLEIKDARAVLQQSGLHLADAVPALREADGFCNIALSATTSSSFNNFVNQALPKLEEACDFMGNTCP